MSRLPSLVQGGIHINCALQDDGVDDQAERPELIFLSLAVALSQFSPSAMEYIARQVMSAFVAIELYQDAPAFVFIANVRQKVIGFDNAPSCWQSADEWRWLIVRP